MRFAGDWSPERSLLEQTLGRPWKERTTQKQMFGVNNIRQKPDEAFREFWYLICRFTQNLEILFEFISVATKARSLCVPCLTWLGTNKRYTCECISIKWDIHSM